MARSEHYTIYNPALRARVWIGLVMRWAGFVLGFGFVGLDLFLDLA